MNVSSQSKLENQDEVAEWLRRWTANPLGSPRVGSNPILVDYMFLHTDWGRITQMKSEKNQSTEIRKGGF